MQINFTKMQGCGNDYVYINGFTGFTEIIPQQQKPDFVRKMSDRHFGIGGDGVIFVNLSQTADFEMEMYNADGTRAEMCGNGIRCVGKFVYDKGLTEKRYPGGKLWKGEVFTAADRGRDGEECPCEYGRAHTES